MKLDNCRKKIDKIDRKIIDLIGQRISAAKEIGRIKEINNIPVTDRKREAEVLAKIRSHSASIRIREQLSEKIFRLIIKESKRIQK